MSSSISAIARTVIKEVIRMRVFMFFMLMTILGLTVFFAMWLSEGSGRPDEKVQTFLSYSTSGIMVVLSFTTMFLSVATVARDIKRREIFTIATKSISRVGYLTGKFLGITIINIVGVLFAFILIYGTAQIMAEKQLSQLTVAEQDHFRGRINNLVFAARDGVYPEIPSMEQQVADIVEQQLADQISRYPGSTSQPDLIEGWRLALTKDAQNAVKSGFLTVPSGGYKVFHFKNVKVRPGSDSVYIRYKMDVSVNPENLKILGQWAIGPEDPTQSKTGQAFQAEDVIRTYHEHSISSSLVSPAGDLYVAFRNPFENGRVSVMFPDKGGLEILYAAGTFEANLLRSIALILMRLIFLTIVSISLGAWLSFPVAVLTVMVVFVMGICSSFILEAIDYGPFSTPATIIEAIMTVMPQLAKFDPSLLLEKGRLVKPALVVECMLWLVLVKGGVIAMLGVAIFRKKELARVIV
ncbi:MAG: ABC transporter permease [Sedimentisphaerales bacterium]|nr:ABC transporter permease [Sedimentisphaerales bacterium]MBN2843345.1 ABC transporter permease [Sedimentisphaerales bacterium]